jgi:acetyltransferase
VPVTFRAIRPEDEPLVAKFHEGLSERTVYLRYLQATNLSERVAHDRLARLVFIDYDREMALVATRRNPYDNSSEIMAIGRLTKIPGQDRAEFAIIVSDRFQHQGLGREMLRRLVRVGQDEKVPRITGNVLAENVEMMRLVQDEGFSLIPTADKALLTAELKLPADGTA